MFWIILFYTLLSFIFQHLAFSVQAEVTFLFFVLCDQVWFVEKEMSVDWEIIGICVGVIGFCCFICFLLLFLYFLVLQFQQCQRPCDFPFIQMVQNFQFQNHDDNNEDGFKYHLLQPEMSEKQQLHNSTASRTELTTTTKKDDRLPTLLINEDRPLDDVKPEIQTNNFVSICLNDDAGDNNDAGDNDAGDNDDDDNLDNDVDNDDDDEENQSPSFFLKSHELLVLEKQLQRVIADGWNMEKELFSENYRHVFGDDDISLAWDCVRQTIMDELHKTNHSIP